MSVFMPYILLIAGIALLYFGADWLVDASAKLALRLGIKPLVVGLTVVAMGTSAPELVVSVQSVLVGKGDISIGNVIGSNICNVALILGLSAIICPISVSKQLFKFDIPVVIAASLLVWFFLKDNTVQIREGVVFLILFIGYIVYSVVNAKNGEKIENNLKKNDSCIKNIAFIILGLGLLVAGANFLVKGAVDLALSWGVSEAVIGLTIVAVGTSLPELATSAIAAFKKQNDIAIGNIVGSNIFNILGILGVVGVMGPVAADGILLRDILTMVGLAVILFSPILTKRILTGREGAVFLGIYIVYTFLIITQ
ncbi:MAG: calcium/sodium antiporter [Chitinispirillales bacterium]|jgi:cation:H+ antiporter|nr:calcium/sodium antiporter [Chitinispirillales bacterium]